MNISIIVNNTSSRVVNFDIIKPCDNCDYNTYIDGINRWSNKNCNNNSNILGSCKECNERIL